MTFTRLIDGYTLKNDARHDGGWLYLRVPTLRDSVHVVCNASDLPLIAPHRWRMAGERIVTTIMENGCEVAIGLENVLLNRPRAERVPATTVNYSTAVGSTLPHPVVYRLHSRMNIASRRRMP